LYYELRKNKKLSLILAIMFAMTILLPLLNPVPANAATGSSALQRPDVNDDFVSALGTVMVELPAGALRAGDVAVIELPEDFEMLRVAPLGTALDPNPGTVASRQQMTLGDWGLSDLNPFVPALPGPPLVPAVPAATDTYGRDALTPNSSFISVPVQVFGEDNALHSNFNAGNPGLQVERMDDNKIRVTVQNAQVNTRAWFYLNLGAVYVPSGADNDIKVSIMGSSGSGFAQVSGEVIVGKVTSGDVTLSVTNKQTRNDTFEVTLRVVESLPGSLEDRTDSLRLRLPDGLVWSTIVRQTHLWGDNIVAPIVINDFTGWNDTNGELRFTPGAAFAESTNNASAFEIVLEFQVDDESRVRDGDITMTVRGNSTVKTSSLVVGAYGDFGVSISADSEPTIIAGLREQEIGDIVIKESIGDSLLANRTITLTLPDNARWERQVDGEENGAVNRPADSTSDRGVTLTNDRFGGTDNRVAYFRVTGNSGNNPAELKFEDVEVVVQPGFTGDLKVTVGGSAGISGEVVVAKVVAPVTMTAASKPTVIIGKKDQAAGDFTITETRAGALDDANLELNLSDGATWTSLPKVEVTEGDLKIGTVTFNNNVVTIPIDRDSTVASTIKVTNCKYTLDRTIPEGDISVRVRGAAAIGDSVNRNTRIFGGTFDIWTDTLNAARVANAVVGTPAPGDTTHSAAFVIGSTTYNVDGVEQTMDVAPYVKDGRTYLPVRYVANALGVDNNNIMWDGASGTATMIKGDKVVQVTVGSKNMIINGANIAMDAAPEIKDGRTMLPFRWIAWAFGANVEWDSATQTVTIN